MNKTLNGLLAAVLTVAGVFAAMDGWSQEGGFRSGAGGLRIKDLQTGQGVAAQEGMVATIQFIGWLDDKGARGREIYNSRAAGRPVSFVVGTDKVMPAWNAGVIGMRPGGTRMLLVPPALAYGQRGVDDVVPPNAPLMLRIELISLEESP